MDSLPNFSSGVDVKNFENHSVWFGFDQLSWFYPHSPLIYCLYANPMLNSSHKIDNCLNSHLCSQQRGWSHATKAPSWTGVTMTMP